MDIYVPRDLRLGASRREAGQRGRGQGWCVWGKRRPQGATFWSLAPENLPRTWGQADVDEEPQDRVTRAGNARSRSMCVHTCKKAPGHVEGATNGNRPQLTTRMSHLPDPLSLQPATESITRALDEVFSVKFAELDGDYRPESRRIERSGIASRDHGTRLRSTSRTS